MTSSSLTRALLAALAAATTLAGCGGGSDDEPTTTRAFITWTNSANGEVVVDANNERFAFYADTRCLYSYNMVQETRNFCLGPGASGSFAGQGVSVLLVRSTSGGCIAALAAPSGHQLDIFTSASGVQTVQASATRWDTTGCSS